MKVLNQPLALLLMLGLAVMGSVQAVYLHRQSVQLRQQVAIFQQSAASAAQVVAPPSAAKGVQSLRGDVFQNTERAMETLRNSQVFNAICLCTLSLFLIYGVSTRLKALFAFFMDMREFVRTPEYHS
jgi:hypothetical protein